MLEELGSGGMASVFLAEDIALDRKVAIKVLSPALVDSPDNSERFKREAKLAASLNHPNIISILAVGDDPELAFFVMKYIEGRSLDSFIRTEGAQPMEFVHAVISAAGRALHHAHLRGVVHRDVKPANVMIDRDGWLIVTDFGIAKQGDAKGLTLTGSVMGTPSYMSPEQFNGFPATPLVDQYALGIVAFELLTGRQPYVGDTLVEVMRGHLVDDVPRVRSLRDELPLHIDECVARMMAKSANDRYATMELAIAAFGSAPVSSEPVVPTRRVTREEFVAMGLQPTSETARPPREAPERIRPGSPAITGQPAQPPMRLSRPRPMEEPESTTSRVPVLIVALLFVLSASAAVIWFTPSLRDAVFPAQAGERSVGP